MQTTANTKQGRFAVNSARVLEQESVPMIGKTETTAFQSLELGVKKQFNRTMTWLRCGVVALATIVASGELLDARALSSVGDFVWQDLNTNGLQDVLEPGVPTNAVRIFDAASNLIDFAATDANGFYRFDNLPAGQYFVGFTLPFGYVGFTSLNAGTNILIDNDSDFDARTALFNLGANQTNLSIDAGMIIAQPAFTFIKTAMNAPDGGIYYATQGEDIVYSYTFINQGNTYFKNFQIFDDQPFDFVWVDSSVLLAPGESVTVTWTNLNLQASVTNIAEICALPVDFKGRDLGIPAMCSQEVAVVLICPDPLVIPPSNITVECDSDYMTTNLTGTISLTNEICDCPITNMAITNVFITGMSCPQSFLIERYFRIQDSCGHDLTVTQFITVVDTTAPVLQNVPTNILVSCTNVPPPAAVTALDNCDTNVPVSLVESNVAGRCEGTYTIIRVWSAADDCNNSVSATQIVNVVDSIPPVLAGVPANTNVSCDAIPPPANVTAIDSCSAAVVTNFTETFQEGNCANQYTLERVWTAWDACSNSISATQLVFVSDTTAPVILSIPTNRTIDCVTRVPLPEPGIVSVTDNCSNVQSLTVTVTTNDNNGTGLPGDAHIVQYIYTVSDECQNTSSATQTITQLCSPSFVLLKELSSPTGRPANVAESVIFTMSVTNTGDVVLGTLRLDDTFDASKLSFVTSQPPVDVVGSGIIVWSNVGPVGIGGVVVVTAEFAAVTSTLPGTTTNAVIASAAWTNGQPVGTQTSRAPVQIAAPGYEIIKTVVSPTNGRVNVGSTIAFRLSLTNTGDIALSPDTLTDTYDSVSLSFTSSSVPPSASSPGLLVWSNLPTLSPGGIYSILVYFSGVSNTYPASSTNTVESQVSVTNGIPLPPKTSSVPYAVVAPVTIGDYVWFDVNTNGVQDVGEHGLTNYVVRLLDLNTNLVAQTLTDGTYLFTNILPGTYIIQFVPKTTSNVFTVQYATTNTSEDSDADPVTGFTAPITFQPGESNRTIDAGFQHVSPVYALLNLVRGENINGKGVVTWVTEGESGTAGFALYRRAEAGQFVRVGEIVPSLGGHDGTQQYSVIDPAAVMGASYEYRLLEYENRGGKNYYGPYTVKFPTVASAPLSTSSRSVATVSAIAQKSVVPVLVASVAPVDAAKIQVSEEGVYHITKSQLAKVLGRAESEISAIIASKSLGMLNEGRSVAFSIDAAGVTFYASKKGSRYSDYNVFILSIGSGSYIADEPVMSTDLQEPSKFDATINVEQNIVARPDIFDDSNADVWLWKTVFGGDSFTTAFDAPGCDSSAPARLSIRLKGAVAGVSHQASFAIAGINLGSAAFNGLESAEIKLDVQNLSAVNNILAIKSLGPSESSFFVDGFTVRYRRLLLADAKGVTFDAEGQEALTIPGLTSSEIDLLDVSDACNPRRISGAAVNSDGNGGYSVSFMPMQRYGRYVVQTTTARKTPDVITPVPATSLRNAGNQADYVIITPSALKTAAQSLASYRSGRGLTTLVVDIEDIYNAFANGTLDPTAIRSFLAYAKSNWSKAPKYVVIVGQGSLDWKNVLGNNDCQIPSLLTRTGYGLQASDKELGDLNGDGMLDVAVGRIPASTAAELQNAINKIKAFEQGGGWRKKAISLADNPDRSGDLGNMSDLYAVSRMKNLSVNRIHLTSTTTQAVVDVRSKLYGALNKTGAGMLTYFGHSTHYRLAAEHLLGRDDVEYVMSNSTQPPIMFTVACLMDDFGTPGLNTLGETLVVSKNGSAAVVGPGQKVDVYEGALMVSATIAAICENGAKRLGDAFISGYNTVVSSGEGSSARAYNLLGDPALDTSAIGRSMTAGGSLILDFDGDGRSDIAAYWPANGQWKTLLTGNGANITTQLGSSAAVAVAADYDGDGITDRAVYDRGNWFIVQSSNGQKITKNWGWNGPIPVPADYDGDNKADYAVFDRASAKWYVSSSKTNTSRIVQWGSSAGIPVPGDYDGDGLADIAVYTPSKGTWHILQSASGQARIVSWGSSAAMPAPSDYDGDGKTDIAVYTPANGLWSIKRSTDGATVQQAWGFKGAAPVPLDHDGDLKADLAVYETATGKWYIRPSGGGASVVVVQGANKGVPAAPQFQINRRYFPKP